MKVFYGPEYKINKETVVAMGKFDGLHEGHLKIINKVKEISKKEKLHSLIYTFNKNPRIVLGQADFTPIMNNQDKIAKIEELGIDYIIFEDFNEKFSNILPEEFVKNILVDKLNIKYIVMGENSNFGKDHKGDIKLMQELGDKYGFKVAIIELLTKNGQVISSTKMREKINL